MTRKEINAAILKKADRLEELTDSDLMLLWRTNRTLIETRCRSFSFLMPFEDLMQEAFFAFRAAVSRFYSKKYNFAFSTILTNSVQWYLIRLLQDNGFLEHEQTTLNALTAVNDGTEEIDLIADRIDYEKEAVSNANFELVLQEYHRTTNRLFNPDEKEICDLLFLGGRSIKEIGKEKRLNAEEIKRICDRVQRRIRSNYAFRHRMLRLCDRVNDLETAAYSNTGLNAFKNNRAASQELYLFLKEDGKVL